MSPRHLTESAPFWLDPTATRWFGTRNRVAASISLRTRQDGGSLMRPPFAMMAFAGALAAPIVLAQGPAPSPSKAARGVQPVGNIPPLSPTAPAPAPSPASPPSRPGLTNGGLFEKPES